MPDYRYDAFISYRHLKRDRRWAKWLHSALEGYQVPEELRDKGFPLQIGRVFRDEEELPASSNLSDAINEALEQSKFLIVVCSTETPKSEWVNAEILKFRELGLHHRILALLIAGNPKESFPPSLVEIRKESIDKTTGEHLVSIEDVEPLAADVRKSRNERLGYLKRLAKLRLAAAIIGCRFDDLQNRERERRKRRQRRNYLICGALTLILLGILGYGHQQNKNTDEIQKRADLNRASHFSDLGKFAEGENDFISAFVNYKKSYDLKEDKEIALKLLEIISKSPKELLAINFTADNDTDRHIDFRPMSNEVYAITNGILISIDILIGSIRKFPDLGEVSNFTFSRDGKNIAIVGQDKTTVSLYNITNEKIERVTTKTICKSSICSDIQDINLFKNTLLVTTVSRTKTGKNLLISVDAVHETENFVIEDAISGLVVNHKLKELLVLSGTTIKIYDALNGNLKRKIEIGTYDRNGNDTVALSPNGKELLTVTESGLIFWDIVSGKEKYEYEGQDRITGARFLEDNTAIVSKTPSNSIDIINLSTMEVVAQSSTLPGGNQSLFVNGEGSIAALYGSNGYLQAWLTIDALPLKPKKSLPDKKTVRSLYDEHGNILFRAENVIRENWNLKNHGSVGGGLPEMGAYTDCIYRRTIKDISCEGWNGILDIEHLTQSAFQQGESTIDWIKIHGLSFDNEWIITTFGSSRHPGSDILSLVGSKKAEIYKDFSVPDILGDTKILISRSKPRLFVLDTFERLIRIFDYQARKEIKPIELNSIKGLPKSVTLTNVRLSKNDRFLIINSDSAIYVIAIDKNELISRIDSANSAIEFVDSNHDDTSIFILSRNGHLRVFDTITWNITSTDMFSLDNDAVILEVDDDKVTYFDFKRKSVMMKAINSKNRYEELISTFNALVESDAVESMKRRYGLSKNGALTWLNGNGKNLASIYLDQMITNYFDHNLRGEGGEGDVANLSTQMDMGAFIKSLNVNANTLKYREKNLFLYSAEKGLLDLLKSLLDQGVDINVTDESSRNALFYAAHYKANKDSKHIDTNKTIEFLIRSGIDARQVDYYGQTALLYSLSSTDTFSENTHQLLANGADPFITDQRGNSALHYAAGQGDYKLLFDILIAAIKQDILVSEINRKNHKGRTPLHFAALNGNSKNVNLLMELGANRFLKDDGGKTAWELAQDNKFEYVSSFIKSARPISFEIPYRTPYLNTYYKIQRRSGKAILQNRIVNGIGFMDREEGYSVVIKGDLPIYMTRVAFDPYRLVISLVGQQSGFTGRKSFGNVVPPNLQDRINISTIELPSPNPDLLRFEFYLADDEEYDIKRGDMNSLVITIFQ